MFLNSFQEQPEFERNFSTTIQTDHSSHRKYRKYLTVLDAAQAPEKLLWSFPWCLFELNRPVAHPFSGAAFPVPSTNPVDAPPATLRHDWLVLREGSWL
jgi:hypothetical protein